MARRLNWSPAAIEDIEAIAAPIERDSPHYARVVASRLVETAEGIPDFPGIRTSGFAKIQIRTKGRPSQRG